MGHVDQRKGFFEQKGVIDAVCPNALMKGEPYNDVIKAAPEGNPHGSSVAGTHVPVMMLELCDCYFDGHRRRPRPFWFLRRDDVDTVVVFIGVSLPVRWRSAGFPGSMGSYLFSVWC